MTLRLPTNADKATVLKAIDAQLAPTPEERAELEHATDAQRAVQTLLALRGDIDLEWGKG